MLINDLTKEDFIGILDEYFADKMHRYQMTMAEVQTLASILNKKINVPLIRETGEEKILIKIVLSIDTFLYDNLPNEFYDLIRSLDRGIDDTEAVRLIKRLTSLANSKINIPYVPEVVEKFIIKFIITTLVNAARRNKDFHNANANAHGFLSVGKNRVDRMINNATMKKGVLFP